jgi:hypothetical protein
VSEEALLESAQLRLFVGSQLSSLRATLLILNSCRANGYSTTFIDEHFRLLSKNVLPKENLLPISEYQATKKLQELGLSYNSIHACQNSCMLFRKEYEHHTAASSVILPVIGE